jgi:hypothetical protein
MREICLTDGREQFPAALARNLRLQKSILDCKMPQTFRVGTAPPEAKQFCALFLKRISARKAVQNAGPTQKRY